MEEEAKRLYLEAYRSLLQAILRLVEVNSKVKPNKLSAKDSRRYKTAMRAGEKAAKLAARTIENVADADLYAQMTASSERVREEIERQIEIVEHLISKQSS